MVSPRRPMLQSIRRPLDEGAGRVMPPNFGPLHAGLSIRRARPRVLSPILVFTLLLATACLLSPRVVPLNADSPLPPALSPAPSQPKTQPTDHKLFIIAFR